MSGCFIPTLSSCPASLLPCHPIYLLKVTGPLGPHWIVGQEANEPIKNLLIQAFKTPICLMIWFYDGQCYSRYNDEWKVWFMSWHTWLFCFMARGKVGTTMSKMAGLCRKLGACLVKNMVHTHSIPNYEKVIYQCIHCRTNCFLALPEIFWHLLMCYLFFTQRMDEHMEKRDPHSVQIWAGAVNFSTLLQKKPMFWYMNWRDAEAHIMVWSPCSLILPKLNNLVT